MVIIKLNLWQKVWSGKYRIFILFLVQLLVSFKILSKLNFIIGIY